ncbi:hypothetical protein KAI46_08320, partial [bacterium]|nr:hypothetical protein [bacterium]
MAASAQHYKTVTETKPSWTTDWLSLCYQSTMPATTEKNLTACIHPSTAPVKTKQGVLEHNEMTLLWADIDSGDLSLDDLKQRAVDHEITEYIIYSTASANRLKTFSKRDEDGIVQKDEDGKPINKQVMQGNRWRVLVSLSRSVGCGEWLQLQAAMANIFSGSDEALRVQQVLFLPTNPDDGYYDSHINKGAPLDPQRLPQRLKQVVDSQVTSELVVVTKPALAPRKVTAEQGSIIEKV